MAAPYMSTASGHRRARFSSSAAALSRAAVDSPEVVGARSTLADTQPARPPWPTRQRATPDAVDASSSTSTTAPKGALQPADAESSSTPSRTVAPLAAMTSFMVAMLLGCGRS